MVPIVTIQNRYSLTDRRHDDALAYCEAQGIGFMPWYPMAGGKLMKPDHPGAKAIAAIAARYSISVAQLSIAWLLHRSPLMLPIPGTSKVGHLDENIAAAALSIGPDEWDEIENAACI